MPHRQHFFLEKCATDQNYDRKCVAGKIFWTEF